MLGGQLRGRGEGWEGRLGVGESMGRRSPPGVVPVLSWVGGHIDIAPGAATPSRGRVAHKKLFP